MKSLSKPTYMNKFAVVFFVSLYLFNDTVRMILPGKLGYINLLFLFSGGLFIVVHFVKSQFNFFVFLIVMLVAAIVMMNNKFLLTYSNANLVLTVTSFLIPLFMTAIVIERGMAVAALRYFLKFFNVLIVCLVVVGLVDVATKGAVQLFLASGPYRGTEIGMLIRFEHATGIFRYYSFIGHPLVTASYFLTFFVFNNVYGRMEKPLLNRYVLIVLTLVGLLLSASKSALVLGLLLIFLFIQIKKHKWLQYIVLGLLLIGLYNTSLFQNNLMQRYADGYESGDLSTGRNELIHTLLSSDIDMPAFVLGGGWGYSRDVAKSLRGDNLNFEYSPIMLAYDYGIVTTLFIYTCLFFYPFFVFVRNKDFVSMIRFIALTIMFNGNNGLSSLEGDALARLCFIIFIMVNVSRRSTGERIGGSGIV